MTFKLSKNLKEDIFVRIICLRIFKVQEGTAKIKDTLSILPNDNFELLCRAPYNCEWSWVIVVTLSKSGESKNFSLLDFVMSLNQNFYLKMNRNVLKFSQDYKVFNYWIIFSSLEPFLSSKSHVTYFSDWIITVWEPKSIYCHEKLIWYSIVMINSKAFVSFLYEFRACGEKSLSFTVCCVKLYVDWTGAGNLSKK